jgi:hypothetical protein
MWLRTTAVRIGLASFLLVPSASASDHKAWTWSKELPVNLGNIGSKANRTARDVDALFARRTGPIGPPRVAAVLAALGRPDGFSRQGMYSLTSGSQKPSRNGGTLRFLLSDGGEQVWTPDFVSVGLAMSWDANGNSTLLFK